MGYQNQYIDTSLKTSPAEKKKKKLYKYFKIYQQ